MMMDTLCHIATGNGVVANVKSLELSDIVVSVDKIEESGVYANTLEAFFDLELHYSVIGYSIFYRLCYSVTKCGSEPINTDKNTDVKRLLDFSIHDTRETMIEIIPDYLAVADKKAKLQKPFMLIKASNLALNSSLALIKDNMTLIDCENRMYSLDDQEQAKEITFWLTESLQSAEVISEFSLSSRSRKAIWDGIRSQVDEKMNKRTPDVSFA